MSFARIALVGGLLLTPVLRAQEDPAAPAESSVAKHVHTEVTGVSLAKLDTDKALVSVGLAVTSDRDLDLSEIRVSRLRLNGMPVFAAPMPGPIHLTKNQTWVAPEPLSVTVYLRDMASLEPLMSALDSNTLTVDGEVTVRVELSRMQRMMLFSGQATVPMKLHQEVKLEVPGGQFGRAGAALLLSGANAALTRLQGPAQGLAGGLRVQVRDRDLPRIATLSSTYELTDPAGKVTAMTWSGVGFFLDAHRMVTVAEALEPWLFDPEIALALRSNEVKLKAGSLRLTAASSNKASHWELGKELTAGAGQSQKKLQMVMPRDGSAMPTKAQVAIREEPQNLVILNLKDDGPAFAPSAAPAPASEAEWDQLAVFRGARNGTVEILLLPAHSENGRIRFGSMVDSDVFGSPLIGPGGIVGVVQDEGTAVPWPEAMKALKIKAE